MRKILILIIFLATIFSCNDDDFKEPSQVNIRLSNISAFDFKNIIVSTSTGEVNFENINSNQKSDYKTFEIAYRYAFVELEIDGQTFTLQPIDYTGETPLERGSYTYEINANDSQEQFEKLSLTFIED